MTPCPPEIAMVLADILQHGFLRIRSEGWSGRADRCAVEADHLHNLPYILADYRPELLEFYWTVERGVYIAQSEGVNIRDFERLWARLEPFVAAELGRKVAEEKPIEAHFG